MKGSVNKYILLFIVLLIIGLVLLIFFYTGVSNLIKDFFGGLTGG